MNIFDFTFLFAAGFNFLRREGDASNDNEGSADPAFICEKPFHFLVSIFSFSFFIVEFRKRMN